MSASSNDDKALGFYSMLETDAPGSSNKRRRVYDLGKYRKRYHAMDNNENYLSARDYAYEFARDMARGSAYLDLLVDFRSACDNYMDRNGIKRDSKKGVAEIERIVDESIVRAAIYVLVILSRASASVGSADGSTVGRADTEIVDDLIRDLTFGREGAKTDLLRIVHNEGIDLYAVARVARADRSFYASAIRQLPIQTVVSMLQSVGLPSIPRFY